MDFEKIRNFIQIEKTKTLHGIKNLETYSVTETQDTFIAAEILLRFLEEKPVSEKQIIFLKAQSIDFVKVLALLGLQAVPGSSVAIIALEKIGEKHGFSIIPRPLDSSGLK